MTMLNRKSGKGLRFILVFVIITISILLFGDHINQYLGTVGLVASVLIVIYQLSSENDVTLGSFILELNAGFTGNERIQTVYTKLKLYEGTKNEAYIIQEEDRANLDEYLVFFETVSVLNKKGVISLNTLDEMFGYRFFIAMNNAFVQDVEIFPTGLDNYEALIELYKEWYKYRQKKGGLKSMPLSESSLMQRL